MTDIEQMYVWAAQTNMRMRARLVIASCYHTVKLMRDALACDSLDFDEWYVQKEAINDFTTAFTHAVSDLILAIDWVTTSCPENPDYSLQVLMEEFGDYGPIDSDPVAE